MKDIGARHFSSAYAIHRPFFLAGIITVLSVGCLWGAVNLLLMGLRQSFGGVNYSWVLAHGHAMVFGFVGFFIMGFAYQAIPRFKDAALWRPDIALSALPLMAIGIGLQILAHLIAKRPPFLELGLAAGLFQFAAVAIFASVIVRTIRQAQKPEGYDGFIYAALGWFLLAAIFNPVIFWLFETASDTNQFLFRIAIFNIPYRDVELFGIAVMMILGVSLRYLPQAYALHTPSNRWRIFLLLGTNSAIVVGIIMSMLRNLFVFRQNFSAGNQWLMMVQEGAAIILLIAAVGAFWQYRLFSSVKDSDFGYGLKFIRAAYVWFIVAMAMLVLVPVYNLLVYQPLTGARIPFSHAFFGAYRHALTVGFITMMIIGVSSKVATTFSGLEAQRNNSLWATFLLLNLGNAARILTEIATDFTPAAYPLTGMTGFIELFGLALWGYELLRNMYVRTHLERA
ncbi:TPA: hypothetical protein EYP66_09805 [Candidatus Poribacteria bacterium]|nr:hypothetical protein [Candidatus Poribacteria bacterium]